jgi:hypothetical protein
MSNENNQNNNARTAKAYARISSYESPSTLPDGQMIFAVEWKLLCGTRQGGKTAFTITEIVNDAQLSSDLREALAAHLSQQFAPEQFRPRDIVGYSV